MEDEKGFLNMLRNSNKYISIRSIYFINFYIYVVDLSANHIVKKSQ